MKLFLHLVHRDLLRSWRSGIWYVAASIFYLAYAVYFDLLFTSAAGPQPQPISPMRTLYSGEMLILWILFIPVLVQKGLVEERQQKTWDVLVTTGMDYALLLVSKYSSSLIQILFWMFLTLIFPWILSWYIEIDVSLMLSSLFVMASVAAHWTALSYWVLSKTKNYVVAYFKSGFVLLLYYIFPLFVVMYPDPYYRPVFETLDLRGVLTRASEGLILAHDLVWLWGGVVLFITLAVIRISGEVYIGLKKARLLLSRALFGLGACLTLYFAISVCHSKHIVLDFSSTREGELSQTYLDVLPSFPEGIEVTVALPKNWNAPSYEQARWCLLSFLQRTQAKVKGMKLEVLDPDVDTLAMDRLRKLGGESQNKIGFVSISLNDKRLNIPYHQWIRIGTMTIDNEPYRYLHSFRGEDQMVRAVNILNKGKHKGKVLVLTGSQELDLQDDGALGGSEFLDLLKQFGLDVVLHNPVLDHEIPLDEVRLVLHLDPQNKLGEVAKGQISTLVENQIPILACEGPGYLNKQDKASAFEPFGIVKQKGVVYQRAYPNYDPLTLPMAEFSDHPLMNGLEGRFLMFDHMSPLEEGIPFDPRLKVAPLLRTQSSELIWGEQQYDSQAPGVRHQRGHLDTPSPIYTAMVLEWVLPNEIKPGVVFLGTRSPFENRWIHKGANREMLFQSIDWLLKRDRQLRLPPSALSDYKIEIEPSKLLVIQGAVTFGPTLFLLMFGFIQYKKRH